MRIERAPRIHARVDAGELSDAGGPNQTLSSLMLARSMLEKVSTWPWSPEAPRLLPIALVIAQRVLATALGIWRSREGRRAPVVPCFRARAR